MISILQRTNKFFATVIHIKHLYNIPQVRGYNPLHTGTVGVAWVQIQEELVGDLRPQKRLKKGKMSPAAPCGQLARFEVLIMTGEYRYGSVLCDEIQYEPRYQQGKDI
jgi:hypothetical protein